MPVSSATEHWIRQDALTINLNHFGDPDYLQVSVLAGAVVMAFKQDVIGYNAAHNYRTWPLDAANTYLETSSAYHLYAKLTRSEVNARALIIYDPILRDIEGREITYATDEETGGVVEVLGEANEDYFYAYLGKISASIGENGEILSREWEAEFRFGSLSTNQYQNEEGGGEWSKMFRLNKVTDMIDVLKTISSAIMKKLSIKNGNKEKVITDIKRSIDSDNEFLTDEKGDVIKDENGKPIPNPDYVPVSDETIPTAKYVKSLSDGLNSRFLRKDQDDNTPYSLGVGGSLDVGGKIVTAEAVETGTFTEGSLGTGASMFVRDGSSYVETDYMTVRKKAFFNNVTIKELKHVGGEIILSPAAMICSKVEDLVSGWKCYFQSEDADGRTVYQEFEAGDQARCQTFNLTNPTTGELENRYYWRLVTEVGNDYIVLSMMDCDPSVVNDEPREGDHISLMGNRNDPMRQNATLLSAYGTDAPSFKQYQGIKDYNLLAENLVTKLSPEGNYIKGDFYSASTGKNLDEEIESIRVDWDNVLNQKDKEFTMWFYPYDPSWDKAPCNEWLTDDLKELHDQDLFFNTSTGTPTSGYAYRFENVEGVWTWTVVTDAETIKALQEIAGVRSSLEEIVSDGILSALEKKTVLKEWKRVVNNYETNIVLAPAFGAEGHAYYTAYIQAYHYLGTYLNGGYWDGTYTPKWLSDVLPDNPDQGEVAPLYQNTPIDPDEYMGYWNGYYQAEKNLVDLFTEIAKDKADEVGESLDEIVSDGILSALEKKTVLRDWQEIVAEYANNVETSNNFGLGFGDDDEQSLVKDDILVEYRDAYQALGSYLNDKTEWEEGTIPKWLSDVPEEEGVLAPLYQNTPIAAVEFRSYWVGYDNSKKLLLNHLSKIAKQKADDAQKEIDDIVADGTLSALEKKEVLRNWEEVVEAHTENVRNAETYEVDATDYTAAFYALGSYLDGDTDETPEEDRWDGVSTPKWLGDEKDVNTPIDPSDYRSKWVGYKDAEIKLLDAVTTAIDKKANELKGRLDNIVADGVLSALEKKEVLKEWLSIEDAYDNNLTIAEAFGMFEDGKMDATWTAYEEAYFTLGGYLNGDEEEGTEWDRESLPEWFRSVKIEGEDVAPMQQDTSIVADTYRARWNDYYDKEGLLMNRISEIAKERADESNEKIDDIVADKKLSALEKKEVLRSWLGIVDAYESNMANVTGDGKYAVYNIPTTAYTGAFVGLGTYLNDGDALTKTGGKWDIPLWLGEKMNENTDIDPTEYREKWVNYHNEEIALLDAISKAIKDATDDVTNNLNDILKDGVLSSLEKKEVLKEWEEIVDAYERNIVNAESYGVSESIKNSYATAYEGLGTYLNGGEEWDGATPLWLSDDAEYGLSKNTDVVSSVYRSKWVNYYSAEVILLDAITTKVKEEADKANGDLADMVSDNVLSVFEKKTLLREWEEALDSYDKNTEEAEEYGIAYGSYTSALNVLGTLLNGGASWTVNSGSTPSWIDEEHINEKTTGISSNAFMDAWISLYAEEIALRKLITAKVNDKADDANDKADDAMDEAGQKRRVFTAQPTDESEYDVGDWWINATYSTLYENETLTCIYAKTKGDTFSIDHWKPTVDETTSHLVKLKDSITAAVGGDLEDINKMLDQTIEGFRVDLDGFGSDLDDLDGRVTTNASAIQVNKDSIAAVSAKFNADGSLKNTAGLVTGDGDFATLFAQEVEDGNIATQAWVRTAVVEGVSEVDIKGDQLRLEGYTIINGKFVVDGGGNVTLTDMTAVNIKATGEINATSGKIGGFHISGSSIVNMIDNVYDDDANIMFFGSDGNVAAIGGNVANAVLGRPIMADFENVASNRYDTNTAMVVSARNAGDNEAIAINGGYISGLALKNQSVSSSSAGLVAAIEHDAGCVVVTGSGGAFLTLPDMQTYDDGHIVKVKRLSTGVVTVKPGVGFGNNQTYGFKYTRDSTNGYIDIYSHQLPQRAEIEIYVKTNGASNVTISILNYAYSVLASVTASTDGIYTIDCSGVAGVPYYLAIGTVGVEVRCAYSGMSNTTLIDYPNKTALTDDGDTYYSSDTASSGALTLGSGEGAEFVYYRDLSVTVGGVTCNGVWVRMK